MFSSEEMMSWMHFEMASVLSWRWLRRTFSGWISWYTSYVSQTARAYEVRVVVRRVQQLVGHVLVGVQLVVQVVAVQD